MRIPAGVVKLFDNNELRQQWPLLLSCFLILLLVNGLPLYSLPFIYREVVAETGWSREQVTLIASIKFGAGASVALAFGWLIDYIGDRRGILIAAVVHTMCVAMFLFADTLWFYYAVGAGMGFSGPAIITGVKTITSRRFHTSQGLAFGLVLTGTSLAGAVTPPLIVTLIHEFGWRMAMSSITTGAWLIAIPFFIYATGRRFAPPVSVPGVAGRPPFKDSLKVIGVLLGEKRFWCVGISLLLVGAVDQGIAQHQVLFLRDDRGLTPEMVATIASAFAIVGIFSKVAFGAIYDRYSVAGVAAAYLILCIDPLLALVVTGPLTAWIFVITRGVGHGALIVDVPVLAKHIYGPHNLGLIIGLFSTFLQLGFTIGPWVMGRLHSVYDNYTNGFILFSASALIAAIILHRIKPAFWLEYRKKSAEPAPAGLPQTTTPQTSTPQMI